MNGLILDPYYLHRTHHSLNINLRKVRRNAMMKYSNCVVFPDILMVIKLKRAKNHKMHWAIERKMVQLHGCMQIKFDRTVRAKKIGNFHINRCHLRGTDGKTCKDFHEK